MKYTVQQLVEEYQLPYLYKKGSNDIYILSSSTMLSINDIRGYDPHHLFSDEVDNEKTLIQVIDKHYFYANVSNIDIERSIEIPVNKWIIKMKDEMS